MLAEEIITIYPPPSHHNDSSHNWHPNHHHNHRDHHHHYDSPLWSSLSLCFGRDVCQKLTWLQQAERTFGQRWRKGFSHEEQKRISYKEPKRISHKEPKRIFHEEQKRIFHDTRGKNKKEKPALCQRRLKFCHDLIVINWYILIRLKLILIRLEREKSFAFRRDSHWRSALTMWPMSCSPFLYLLYFYGGV